MPGYRYAAGRCSARKLIDMNVKIEVSIDGKPIAGALYERLLSITVTAKTEVKSDALDIELNVGCCSFWRNCAKARADRWSAWLPRGPLARSDNSSSTR